MPRILLVDDDEALRKMLRLRLVKLGHEVLEAANGKEALRLCEAVPPDLVVTDLIMPEKEGLETIAQLRRLRPDVKIIAMSGGGRINARDFLKIAKLMGASATLEKPFSHQELAMVIETHLGPAPIQEGETGE
jgi:two-component system, chemotaxis family, chemotaxis protein CheY